MRKGYRRILWGKGVGDTYAWGFSSIFWRTELIVRNYDWPGLPCIVPFLISCRNLLSAVVQFTLVLKVASESQNSPQEGSKLGMKHVKNINNRH